MKALRLHDVGNLFIHEEPVPVPGIGEALLRVKVVSICGSDLHWYQEGTTGDGIITEPFILGYGFSGVIEGGDMEKGVRVAIDPNIPCDVCKFCLEGKSNLCLDHYFAGHAPVDGVLCEYMAWPRNALIPIPDVPSYEDVAVLEPLGVAIHTVDLGHVKPGMTMWVYGCGPIGLLAIQIARAAGVSRIIATDILPHRVEAAKEFGADQVFLAAPEGYELNTAVSASQNL
jgi:L-iditol 2-dehydrogenase